MLQRKRSSSNDVGWITAVFEEDDEIHVMPVRVSTGKHLRPHQFSINCPCHPGVDDAEDTIVVVHNMIQ